MKVMITGACGFLARGLIKELEERGHELVLLDRVDPEDATVFWPGSSERMKSPLVTKWPYVTAEISDAEAVAGAVQGVDAVVHLAAILTGYPDQGSAIMHVNVCGTYGILDAARRARVSRFFCASSINAFGTFYWRISGKPVDYSSMPLDESFDPVPEDPYSLSKLCNEHTCAAFSRAYGITTAAFRFAGVWNLDQYAKARSAPLPPTDAWSDDLYQWVHVSDIVTGIRQALEESNLPLFGAYTLAAADTRCPEDTMNILRKFKPGLAENLTAPLPSRSALLSIRKARETFGYSPQYRLGV
jgi:nucleoside-diphosphate-sugar epimerase